MKKKMVLGLIIGSSMFTYGCTEKEVKIVDFVPTNEIKVSESNGKAKEENLVFAKYATERLDYDGIAFRDGKIILKYYVIDEEVHKNVRNELDIKEGNSLWYGKDRIEYVGDILQIGGKNYLRATKQERMISPDGYIMIGGNKTYKLKQVEFEVIVEKEDLTLDGVIGKPLKFKFIKEEKDFEKIRVRNEEENLYYNEYEKYLDIRKERIEKDDYKKLISELNEEYEENFVNLYEDGSDGAQAILGTDEYVKFNFIMKDNVICFYNIKTKERFSMLIEAEEDYNFFFHDGKPMAINEDGDLQTFKLKKGKIEKSKLYKSGIDFTEGESKGFNTIVYKDEEHVYVHHVSSTKSDIKQKDARRVLYSYNLENKKINLIGDTEFSDGQFISDVSLNGQVLYTEGTSISLGKLSGDKIETTIKDIGTPKSFVVAYGKDYIMINKDPFAAENASSYGNDANNSIEIYKLK